MSGEHAYTITTGRTRSRRRNGARPFAWWARFETADRYAVGYGTDEHEAILNAAREAQGMLASDKHEQLTL